MTISKRTELLLQGHDCHYVGIEHKPTHSAEGHLKQLSCSPRNMAKSVVLKADSDFIMYVEPANEMLHVPTLREGLDAHIVELATEKDLAEIFDDCKVGAQTIFGSIYGLDTYISSHFKANEVIYFAGGDYDVTLMMPYKEFVELEHPKVLDCSRELKSYDDYVQEYLRNHLNFI